MTLSGYSVCPDFYLRPLSAVPIHFSVCKVVTVTTACSLQVLRSSPAIIKCISPNFFVTNELCNFSKKRSKIHRDLMVYDGVVVRLFFCLSCASRPQLYVRIETSSQKSSKITTFGCRHVAFLYWSI